MKRFADFKKLDELEKQGVDVLEISGGMCLYFTNDDYPGFFDYLSKPIYDELDIPVILTG